MITLKNVTMRNFLSIGNTTQAINLDENAITLILGENIDQGSGGSRNGVGKTSLIQAICYAIYGNPLTNIKKDNLVNKINQKQMVVSLDFEEKNKKYRIERGRKPNFLKFYVNDGLVNEEGTDEAHGESKVTQQEIEKIFGCSHLLFKHIIALHSKTTPFLDLNTKDQRAIIEELFGITQLSTKADRLKDQIKETKEEIRNEELRIKVMKENNEKIQRTINELHFKNNLWEKEHSKNIDKIKHAIDQLNLIDIDNEITNHKILTEWNIIFNDIKSIEKETITAEKVANSYQTSLDDILSQLQKTNNHECHACGQTIHDDQQDEIKKVLEDKKVILETEVKTANDELYRIASSLEAKYSELTKLGDKPEVFYNNLEEALNHRHTLEKLNDELVREENTISPFIDQIANLSVSGMSDITFDFLQELLKLKEHQDFLLKLLTDKNSFIRKKIIDQNLSYLNIRLNYYLNKLQLPHEVIFQSDLSVEISRLGKEYDFAQLSAGEQNRLVLSLAWSFRDVWETMNKPINLLMIDELVDSGMDSKGMDLSLAILKKNSIEQHKNTFLISHKDELTSKVPNILLVQYENNFTSYVKDTEPEN